MEPHRKCSNVSGQLAVLSVAGVEIDRWNKLSAAVASGSFVGRLTTGRVDGATRKMTSSREVYIVWYEYTGLLLHASCCMLHAEEAARLQFKF